jgi:hypothetical protein
VIRRHIAPERRQVIDLPPELMLQVMDDRARARPPRQLAAAEASSDFTGMLAQMNPPAPQKR